MDGCYVYCVYLFIYPYRSFSFLNINVITEIMKLYTTYSKSDLVRYMNYNEYLGNVEEVSRLEEYALWRYGKVWNNYVIYVKNPKKWIMIGSVKIVEMR